MISFTRSSPSLNELLAHGIYTIPAGLPFAQDLAVGILASVQTPEQLGDKNSAASAVAAQALKTAFYPTVRDRHCFLPDMQPIGDVDELDPGYLSQHFQADDLIDLLPAISLTDRQTILAVLYKAGQLRPAICCTGFSAGSKLLAGFWNRFISLVGVFRFKRRRYATRICQTLVRNCYFSALFCKTGQKLQKRWV